MVVGTKQDLQRGDFPYEEIEATVRTDSINFRPFIVFRLTFSNKRPPAPPTEQTYKTVEEKAPQPGQATQPELCS